MKYNTTLLRVALSLLVLLIISSDLLAQRRYSRGRGWSNNNYYAYNYRPARPGFSVNIGRSYSYYNRPVYRHSRSYVHFGPAFGVRINVLPVGYDPFYIGNHPYYYNNGVYYHSYSGGGYEVIAPPLGATVKRLPAGARVTVIDGIKYYELGGTYYQEEITDNNKLRYKVVGTDGVLNTNDGAATTIDEDAATVSRATDSAAVATPSQSTASIPETGSRLDQLPLGTKVVILKKEKYYLSPAGVYYQEVIEGEKIRYEVTGNTEVEK